MRVFRNDAITADEAEALAPSRLVVSPAPAGPRTGVSVELIRRLGPRVPTLGVCLGHQAIVEAFGGDVGQAKALLHGKASPVERRPRRLRRPARPVRGRPLPLARCAHVPTSSRVTAQRRRRGDGRPPPRAADRGRPVPPGSVLTPLGPRLGRNFLERRDPGGARGPARGQRPGPTALPRGDGRDHARRRDAGADRRLPRRAATEGRDRRRDRGLRRGDARARPAGAQPQRDDLVDTAGTGGDGAATVNISTAAAIVAAAAGPGSPSTATAPSRPRRAPPTCSRRSASARAAAGADRAVDRRARLRLHVRPLAPPRCAAAPVRQELATRTVFNVLGPLEPRRRPRAGDRRLREAARAHDRGGAGPAGARRAFVVHGAYGIDELSPAGPNDVCEVVDGDVRDRVIDPLDLGVERCDPDELRGGSPPRTRPRSARSRGRAAGCATRSCSTRPVPSRPPAMPRICAKGSARARPIDSAPPPRASTSSPGSRMRFSDALAGPGLGAIAEIKRRSPSLGDIRPDADPA